MAKGTFGERLKRERELREVTLKEIAGATRIAPRFLEALENEAWDKLPGGVFGRGFVRTIARYLGLSEENLLSEYDLARGESAATETQKPEERIPAPPKWIPALAALLIVGILAGLVVGGAYGWRAYKARRDAKKKLTFNSAPAPAMAGMNPAASNPASSAVTTAAATLDLSVSASANTQLRVVADGSVIFEKGIARGETLHFAASDRFEVTALDLSTVLLELNGRAVPPSARPAASGTILLTAQDLRTTNGGVP